MSPPRAKVMCRRSSLVLIIVGHELLEVRSLEEAERVGLLS